MNEVVKEKPKVLWRPQKLDISEKQIVHWGKLDNEHPAQAKRLSCQQPLSYRSRAAAPALEFAPHHKVYQVCGLEILASVPALLGFYIALFQLLSLLLFILLRTGMLTLKGVKHRENSLSWHFFLWAQKNIEALLSLWEMDFSDSIWSPYCYHGGFWWKSGSPLGCCWHKSCREGENTLLLLSWSLLLRKPTKKRQIFILLVF